MSHLDVLRPVGEPAAVSTLPNASKHSWTR